MSIGGDYTRPVYVNGYQCWNCTQVDEAKKGVDPADPKAGMVGPDVGVPLSAKAASGQDPAVSYGGTLSGAQASAAATKPPIGAGGGSALDLTV